MITGVKLMKTLKKICRIVTTVSLLLLILLCVLAFFQQNGIIFVLFGVTITFYIRFFISLVCISMAISFICRIFVKKTMTKILTGIGILICIFICAVTIVDTYTQIDNFRLYAKIISEDSKHTLYQLKRTNLLNQTASDYYIKSGVFTYKYVFDCDMGTIPEIVWQKDGFFYAGKFYLY